jgi:BCD family chlorophyll transporter-like MFS transporter
MSAAPDRRPQPEAARARADANRQAWARTIRWLLPFADAGSERLPLSRLVRLSLFQVSVGMAAVLLTGTLNRVMIVELGVEEAVVALMVALPLLAAPLRALMGYRSDTHVSVLGWKRLPYVWAGTMAQFGGFAILPFALLILSGDTHGPVWIGHVAAAIGFLLVGAGMHMTQTAGLALAADLADDTHRPRVVALLHAMLLAGMLVSGVVIGALLADFDAIRLIQVIQGVAVATLVLNAIAIWKQEVRQPTARPPRRRAGGFARAWSAMEAVPGAMRLLVATGLGTLGFAMQDILLEPYGAQVLGLAVGQTTQLTALWAGGALIAFAMAAHWLARAADPHRLAGYGALVGACAFAIVILGGTLTSTPVFVAGVALIGFGNGWFAVGTLTAAMERAGSRSAGITLGAWGAVQASAAGAGVALGGLLRQVGDALAAAGAFGPDFTGPVAGYAFVYHIEIAVLFAALIAIGPLARHARAPAIGDRRFGHGEKPT